MTLPAGSFSAFLFPCLLYAVFVSTSHLPPAASQPVNLLPIHLSSSSSILWLFTLCLPDCSVTNRTSICFRPLRSVPVIFVLVTLLPMISSWLTFSLFCSRFILACLSVCLLSNRHPPAISSQHAAPSASLSSCPFPILSSSESVFVFWSYLQNWTKTGLLGERWFFTV